MAAIYSEVVLYSGLGVNTTILQQAASLPLEHVMQKEYITQSALIRGASQLLRNNIVASKNA